MRHLNRSARLTAVALAACLSGCGGGGGGGSAEVDYVPFNGTRTYETSPVNGAGFTGDTTITATITDSRAASAGDVLVVITSSDGRFNRTGMTVTAISANRIDGVITGTDGSVCEVTIIFVDSGARIQITFRSAGQAVTGTGGSVNTPPSLSASVAPTSLSFIGGEVTVTVIASDPEGSAVQLGGAVVGGQAFTFTAQQAGGFVGTALVPGNGTGQAVERTITVTASDGTDSLSVSVKVTVAAAPVPPGGGTEPPVPSI